MREPLEPWASSLLLAGGGGGGGVFSHGRGLPSNTFPHLREFLQQMCIEQLLCARRGGDIAVSGASVDPVCRVLTVWWGAQAKEKLNRGMEVL